MNGVQNGSFTPLPAAYWSVAGNVGTSVFSLPNSSLLHHAMTKPPNSHWLPLGKGLMQFGVFQCVSVSSQQISTEFGQWRSLKFCENEQSSREEKAYQGSGWKTGQSMSPPLISH